MGSQLLAKDIDGNYYSGGLLSDVTYRFFANGYLLTTSMYNSTLRRWIPIQLSWLNGLSDEHYKAHFVALMNQIKNSPLSRSAQDSLVRQVVDFSAAQKTGFIEAYMEVFDEKDQSRALSRLHGCKEHFRAQITRVKRNRTIIPFKKEVCMSSKSLRVTE